MRNGRSLAFVQNPVPSFSYEHILAVEEARRALTELTRQAYPQAYLNGFGKKKGDNGGGNEKVSKLTIPAHELEGGVSRILSDEKVSFLLAKEAETRPKFEEEGLKAVFQSFAKTAFDKFPDSTIINYNALVDAQCVACMKDERFSPTAGMTFGKEFAIGQQRLDDLVNGGWSSLLITDKKLAEGRSQREELTPRCEIHGTNDVYQLAVVHQFFAAEMRKGTHGKVQAQPGSPIVEARIKTTFQYLWKLTKLLEGQREAITDAFAARIRTPSDKEYALTYVTLAMDSPQISWHGAIIAQNYRNGEFEGFMRAQLQGENGKKSYFESQIAPNIMHETKPLVIGSNGNRQPAQYAEMFRPLPNGHSTQGLNAIDTFVLTDDTHTKMNGVQEQSRIGYEKRRRDSQTELADWLIASKLAGISLDPSSVEYNKLIVNGRLAEILKK